MKVKTLEQAEMAIKKTAIYIKREFGVRSRDKFLSKVEETKELLSFNPYLGPVEPLLADRPTTYRSVVVANMNKMVYRITDDCIEIADFWDCRREPKALVEQTSGVEN